MELDPEEMFYSKKAQGNAHHRMKVFEKGNSRLQEENESLRRERNGLQRKVCKLEGKKDEMKCEIKQLKMTNARLEKQLKIEQKKQIGAHSKSEVKVGIS